MYTNFKIQYSHELSSELIVNYVLVLAVLSDDCDCVLTLHIISCP